MSSVDSQITAPPSLEPYAASAESHGGNCRTKILWYAPLISTKTIVGFDTKSEQREASQRTKVTIEI